MQNLILIIICPLALCLLDVASGYVSAIRNGTLSSSVMREGLWNKTAEVLAILLAIVVQMCLYLFGQGFLDANLAPFGGNVTDYPVIAAVCAYISVYEITSIIENIGKMNEKLGRWLVKKLGVTASQVGLTKKDEEVDDD